MTDEQAHGKVTSQEALEQERANALTVSNDLLSKAELAGANARAVQLQYGLVLVENNPFELSDPQYSAYHFGYEMERLIRG